MLKQKTNPQKSLWLYIFFLTSNNSLFELTNISSRKDLTEDEKRSCKMFYMTRIDFILKKYLSNGKYLSLSLFFFFFFFFFFVSLFFLTRIFFFPKKSLRNGDLPPPSLFFFFFFFFFLGPHLPAHGSSQAWGGFRASAASLCHSYRNSAHPEFLSISILVLLLDPHPLSTSLWYYILAIVLLKCDAQNLNLIH